MIAARYAHSLWPVPFAIAQSQEGEMLHHGLGVQQGCFSDVVLLMVFGRVYGANAASNSSSLLGESPTWLHDFQAVPTVFAGLGWPEAGL